MSNERPDEFFSWRSRLDRPDALPEQGLADRNGSWEKLAGRLRKDRRHSHPGQDNNDARPAGNPRIEAEAPRQVVGRRRIAYRLAAACLVLALIPAAFLFHPVPRPSNPAVTSSNSTAPSSGLETENSPLLQSGPTAKDLARRSASNQRPGAGLRPPGASPLQRPEADPRLPGANLTNPAPRAHNPPAGSHNPTRPAQTPPVSPDLAATHPDPLQKDSPPALAALPPSADSPKLYSQLTAPLEANKPLINKQLRVVHINELEPSRRSEPALTSAQRREPEIKVLILFNNH